jgi:periplasmic copper chaperone A
MTRPLAYLALAVALFTVTACSPGTPPASADPVASRSSPECAPVLASPWVRAAPPGASMLAGYAVLRNDCGTPVTVVGVESLDFASASIHETIVEDGISRMREVGPIVVPEHGTLVLEPGARHLMLMQPARALAEGDRARARLVLADGRRVFAQFTVRRDAPR